MKTIKWGNNEISVKSSWDEMTIHNALELSSVLESTLPQELKNVGVASIVTGLSDKEVEDLPYQVFTKVMSTTGWMNKDIPQCRVKDNATINGKRFLVNLRVDMLTTSQYIDFISLMQEPKENMHRLLALFVWPAEEEKSWNGVKLTRAKADFEEVATFLLNNMPIPMASSLLLFFSQVWMRLISHTRFSLEETTKSIKRRMSIRKKLGLMDKMEHKAGLELLGMSLRKLDDLGTKYTR